MPNSSRDATETAELLACYRLFELPPTASADEIHKRYHHLARQWHPDGFTGRDDLPLAEAKMKSINAAYLRIKDAPLAGRPATTAGRPHRRGARSRPGPRPRTRSRAAGSFMSWLRSVQGAEPGVPEGLWERDCPNCGERVQVEGCRYKYCGHCGVGFFPDREGAPEEWEAAFRPTTWRESAVAIAFYIAFIILQFLLR